jgi:hypothetical protein
MNHCHTLAADNIACLEQVVALLQRIDDAAFVRSNADFHKSGFGPHLRHCLDHYEQFLAGLSSGRVDYDARTRDRRVETDRVFALQKIPQIIAGLGRIGPGHGDHPVKVKMDCGGEHAGAEQWTGSTVGRELQFLVSHTVHHYALIAFILRAGGVEPGADFGVAPSTLRHQQAQASCAQ